MGQQHGAREISGADHIDTRPGFRAMLERLLSNGVRTIVVETANRFARDLMVQEVGFAMLKERGITLIAADSPDAFLDDTPTSRLIRQVLGSVSEFEKAMLVSKLRPRAQARQRSQGGGSQEPRRGTARGRRLGQDPAPAPSPWLRDVVSRYLGRAVRAWPCQQERQGLHGLVGQEDAGLIGSAAQLSVKAALVRLGLVSS